MAYHKNECTCWCEYPNDNYKRYDRSGNVASWKCVDHYECIGKTSGGKTKCLRIIQTDCSWK